MNNIIEFFIGEPVGILDDLSVEFDSDRLGGKGISKSITFFNDNLATKAKNFKSSEQNDIDKFL